MLHGLRGPRFADRTDAGRQLVDAVRAALPGNADGLLVLGLPRGGVVVAAAVARAVPAELDVLVVRKVARPPHPELALGAVTAYGVVRNEELLHRLGVSETEFDDLAAGQQPEVAGREARYRPGRRPLQLAGRPVLVVDDGLATGATARAALQASRILAPRWLGLAVPVAAPDAATAIAAEADSVVAVITPARFGAVSRYYRDFPQTSDEEVVAILSTGPGDPGDPGESADRDAGPGPAV